MRLCKDCRHAEYTGIYFKTQFCRHPEVWNNGRFQVAGNVRFFGICGKEGKLWEPRSGVSNYVAEAKKIEVSD